MVYLASASAVKRCLVNQGSGEKLDNKNYVLNHERTKYENTKNQRGLINQTLVDRRWGVEIQEQVDVPLPFSRFSFFVFS